MNHLSAPVRPSAPPVRQRTRESECASAPVRPYRAHAAHTHSATANRNRIQCAVGAHDRERHSA